MTLLREKKGLQGRWPKTLMMFFLPFVVFFLLRSFYYEPFVIPSESMVPNLLIHDHIIVNKHLYGLKSFFGDGWIWRFREPLRGDVVVFRFPQNRNVFYIKRLIGLPGDKVSVHGTSLSVNGNLLNLEATSDLNLYRENNGHDEYTVMYEDYDTTDEQAQTFTVPPGRYFVLGDNRNNSFDSRFWGTVPAELLVGRAEAIWLSCDAMLESAPFICDLQTLRRDRIFKKIE